MPAGRNGNPDREAGRGSLALSGAGRAGRAIRAAGAVAWRRGPDGPLIAVVHRPRYDDWSFPKGKLEPGEHPLLAAVREVAEEAHTQVVLGRRLGTARYLADGRPKRVDYWAGRAAGPPRAEPGAEVDQVQWLAVHDVRKRLTYRRDAALLDEFLAAPADTVPVVLVRHASAGRKAAAAGPDLGRPLDAAGIADADALARLFGCFGSLQVHSSQAERCLATVRPYAAIAGVKVHAEPAFTVDGTEPAGPDAAADLAQAAADRAAELAAAGQPLLLCGHRENLPGMLGAVCRVLRSAPPAGEPLGKGSFWVLQAAAGNLVSAERQHLGRMAKR